MNFLFLDIDGVLNSVRSAAVKIGPAIETSPLAQQLLKLDNQDDEMTSGAGLAFSVKMSLECVDPVCVALLNIILRADKELVLVLSSSHRHFFYSNKVPYQSPEHLNRLRLYLRALGIEVPARFSITGREAASRGEQIKLWLDAATKTTWFQPDHRYVILDDGTDMLKGQPHVKTDADIGLSFSDYRIACAHLGIIPQEGVFL